MHEIKFLLVYISSGTRQLEREIKYILGARNGFGTVASKSIARRKTKVK